MPWLGRAAVAGAAAVLIAMLVLLSLQLAVLRDSRQHIVAQDRKINRLMKQAAPPLRRAGSLAEQLRTTVVPLLRELGATELAAAIDVTARLTGALDADGRLVRLVDESTALLDAVRGSDYLGRSLRAADLAPLIARILTETLAVQRETLGTQRTTLGIQRETLAIQKRTLAIQEEALIHIRSIDRKTGGTAPPVPAP